MSGEKRRDDAAHRTPTTMEEAIEGVNYWDGKLHDWNCLHDDHDLDVILHYLRSFIVCERRFAIRSTTRPSTKRRK